MSLPSRWRLSLGQVSVLTAGAVWVGCSSQDYWVSPHGAEAEGSGGRASAPTSTGGRGSSGAATKGGSSAAGATNQGGSGAAGTTALDYGGSSTALGGDSSIGASGGEPALSTGGALASGGASANGGTIAVGGGPNGGALSSGGAVNVAGSIGSGGVLSSAGATTTGGAKSSGGTGTAGTPVTGGVPAAGRAAIGGEATGGAATGGTAAGGAATGGVPATGGAATGGAPSCAVGAVFCEDFETGTAQWTVLQGTWATATDGTTVYGCSLGTNEARSIAGSATWNDYTVSASIKLIQLGSGKRIYLAARATDASNWYGASFYNDATLAIQLRKKVAGTSSTLASVNFAWATGKWYRVALKLSGSTLTMSIDGTPLLTATDTSFTTGRIALLADQSQISVDDVIVTLP